MALPAVTQTRIYNRALALLGSTNRSTNTDDGHPWTETLNELWPQAVRDLLAEHPWNGCVARATLNKGAAPQWGEGHTYQLPADCLRWLPQAKDSCGDDVDAVAETHDGKNVLIADAGDHLYIRYIKLIDDVTRWSPHMVDAMGYRLAMDGAEALTQSESIVENMRVKYEGPDGEGGALAKAKRADGLATGDRDRGNVKVRSRTLSAAMTPSYPRAPGR